MAPPLTSRIQAFVRAHELVPPGGAVTCLVSGGADSTCLWHALRALAYDVSAVHVHHGVRGADADADAEHCATTLDARVVRVEPVPTEAAMRSLRYAVTQACGLRATGHTATDQIETVLYRIVSSGSTRGIKVRREDGVVRPLLDVTREETVAYCEENGLDVRIDATNPDTTRGQIREEILPLLRRIHPGVDANLRALGEARPSLPRGMEASLVELLSSRAGSRSADLGNGVRAVREYDTLRLEGTLEWGPWTLEARRDGLEVRTRRPGDHLAGRRKKVQDLFVDAKVPRAERETWPIVVCEDVVVAVPGIAAAPGWEDAVEARRSS
ncbi:MAG: tRNA lysidine(34) synthetase TilS [Thermoleophilia bacterium]|nr:tRNA lysidine(34) synthetase TilS [Thermoleophilia bacterium]